MALPTEAEIVTIDLAMLAEMQKQIDEAMGAISDLDWQVSKSKHIIGKYKDLVVKMQLQLNQKDYKISQIASERDNYRRAASELNQTFQQLKRSLKPCKTEKTQSPLRTPDLSKRSSVCDD